MASASSTSTSEKLHSSSAATLPAYLRALKRGCRPSTGCGICVTSNLQAGVGGGGADYPHPKVAVIVTDGPVRGHMASLSGAAKAACSGALLREGERPLCASACSPMQ